MLMLFLQKIFKEDSANTSYINRESAFCLFIILLACIKQLYGVQHHLDLPFFDESMYLKKGMFMQEHAYNDWGPSYNLWYFILSKFTKNGVQTFYLNYCLLTTLIPLLLFILLVRFGIKNAVALVFCLSFLMQPILVNNFTYVSHFCLLIILTAFIILSYVKENQTKIIIAFTAAYICTYARQEFLLIAATLLLLWIMLVIYERKLKLSAAYIGLVVSVFGLYLIFGFISFKALGIDRSYFAFIQHFYVNYAVWNKKLYTIEEFKKLDIFHGSKTMFQCLLANPGIFIKHMLTNVLGYFLQTYKHLENFILPQPIFHYLGKGKHILFLSFIIYFFFLLFKRKTYKNIIEFVQHHRFTSLLIAIFFVWSFFSIIFIFPEKHYIIMQFGWLILIFAIILRNHLGWLNKSMILLGIVIVLLIFTPTSSNIGYFHNMVIDARKQPNLKTVNYLTSNNPKTELNIFTTEQTFEAYLPNNYHDDFIDLDSLKPYTKDGNIDIEQYFMDKKISIIFMNEKMQFLIKETLSETGKTLLYNPEKIGFRKQIIDRDLNAYLLIKIDK